MTKVLLTGFEPFGKATLNPSGEIVKQISGDNIVTAILNNQILGYTNTSRKVEVGGLFTCNMRSPTT